MRRQTLCFISSFLCFKMFLALIQQAAPRAADARWVEVPDSFYYPKSGAAVVYDEKNERLVMFGGAITVNDVRGDLSFGPLYVSNQMLAFKNGSWSMLNRYNDLSVISPRNCALFTWDPTAKRMIVAGGDAGYLLLGDVWSFDGQAVQKLFEDETTRANRWGSLFHNSHLNKVCLLGMDGKVYALQSGGWVSLNGTPPAGWGGGAGRMAAFKASFSPSSKNLVVFGGQEDAIGPVSLFDTTYVYNAATNSWSRPEPAVHPNARAWHTMTYSPERGRHVLVGGFRDGVGALADAWEFNDANNAWSQLSIENPIAMYGSVLVRDAKQGALLVLGGESGGHWADCIYELRYIAPASVPDFTLYSRLGPSRGGSAGPEKDGMSGEIEPRFSSAPATGHAAHLAEYNR